MYPNSGGTLTCLLQALLNRIHAGEGHGTQTAVPSAAATAVSLEPAGTSDAPAACPPVTPQADKGLPASHSASQTQPTAAAADWTVMDMDVTFCNTPTARRTAHKRRAGGTWQWAELGPPRVKRQRLMSATSDERQGHEASTAAAAAAATDVQSMQQGCLGVAVLIPDDACCSIQQMKEQQASCSLQQPATPKRLLQQPYCRSRLTVQAAGCRRPAMAAQPPCSTGCGEPQYSQACEGRPAVPLPLPPPPPLLSQQQQHCCPPSSQPDSMHSGNSGTSSTLAGRVWSSVQATAKLLLSMPQRAGHTPVQPQQSDMMQQGQPAPAEQHSQQSHRSPAAQTPANVRPLHQVPPQTERQQAQHGQPQAAMFQTLRSAGRLPRSASLCALSGTAACLGSRNSAEAPDAGRLDKLPRCHTAPPTLAQEPSPCSHPQQVICWISMLSSSMSVRGNVAPRVSNVRARLATSYEVQPGTLCRIACR